MSKWREVRLGEVVDVISGHAFKTNDFKEMGDAPVIKIGNINHFDVDIYKNVSYVDKNLVDTLNDKYIIKKGDILISLTGSNINQPNSVVGRVGKYRESQKSVLNQRAGKIIPCVKVNKDYIYYLFSTESMTYQIAIVAYGGANQVNISPSIIKNFKIQIPDLQTQEKIADVLSTYDELIENNNRRIELLEKTTEEIYKEWFVRMRFPGYEDTKFEKGIPEGWEVKKVGDLISFDIGGGWGKDKKEPSFEEKAYVIRGTDIPDMKYGKFNYDILRFHKKSNLEKRRLNNRDIIFEVSGGSSNQRLGRSLYIIDELLSIFNEDVVCASFCKLIRVSDEYLSWFINNYINYAYKTEILSTFEVQSTGITNFGFTSFKKHHNILIPTRGLIRYFYDQTFDTYINIVNLWRQNQNLIKQRDLLLPRLMNRTIEVR